MFWHKYEERLAKDISTLQAELDVLADRERTTQGESRQHIAAELELLKQMATLLEEWSQRQMRKVVDRIEAERNDS